MLSLKWWLDLRGISAKERIWRFLSSFLKYPNPSRHLPPPTNYCFMKHARNLLRELSGIPENSSSFSARIPLRWKMHYNPLFLHCNILRSVPSVHPSPIFHNIIDIHDTCNRLKFGLNPLPPSDAVPEQKKKHIRGSFQLSIVTLKKYHPSENLKFNNSGISPSLKLLILMEKSFQYHWS